MKTHILNYEQATKLGQLTEQGYRRDQRLSQITSGIILNKGADTWFLSPDGQIIHNPNPVILEIQSRIAPLN